MVTWIVIGTVVVGLLVLATAVGTVARRLGGLRTAALALLSQQAKAQALQTSVAALQERTEALQRRGEVAADQMAIIRARRGDH